MFDPYTTLGVSKNAAQEEIKKSYRKLAKNFHPDLNPGNKEAEKKFKDVSHAFDLIGTPQARAKFDRGETDEQQQRQYEEFMRRRQEGPSYYQTQHDQGRYSFNFGEDINASDFFENLFGSGRRGGGTDFPGEDLTYKMEVDFKEAALGAKKVITLPGGKKIEVKIPAGIESGQKLRFRGLGNPGIGKGPSGDAYIEISVLPHSGFSRKGMDIISELPVSFMEALIGEEIQVETIDGPVMLRIPPGVSTGSKLRIRAKGAGKGSTRGSHIVNIRVEMPKEVDPALRSAVENLKQKYDYNPRTP